MRIAISNIAWDTQEDEEVANLLTRYAVDAIDVAPGKYFADPLNAREEDITAAKHWWNERGIDITGMQSLLFGTQGLNLFGPPDVRQTMLDHLDAICRIASILGATRLVFGSPKNRNREGLDDSAAQDVAVHFFTALGNIAQSYGVIICLEPNPPCYGANFMTDSPQTATIVQAVSHPAIRMQFDTGSLAINQENPSNILAQYTNLIGHVHISEPQLLPIGDGDTNHAAMHAAIARHLPNHILSIEMLATAQEPHLNVIERALQHTIHHYRPNL